MSLQRVQGLVQAAISQGLLPAHATVPVQDSRPWPVVLLTALGAWLAAVPMLAVVGLLLGDWLSRGAGYYVVGGLLLVAAVVVLRSRSLPLFAEQLALPALLVGGATFGAGLFTDLPDPGAAALMAVLCLGVAALVARPWLRVLLGAAAAALVALACTPVHTHGVQSLPVWLAWQVTLAIGLLALWAQQAVLKGGLRARAAAALESLASGWLITTLAGLAWWAGMSFGVGASLGSGLAAEVARHVTEPAPLPSLLPQAGSVALALAALAWAARQWPTLRQPWLFAVGLVLLGLAWFMPTLGAVLLVLAVCCTSARWRMAGAAACAAAWIVGAFYYQLQWPLAHKVLLMMGAGAWLGGLAWFAHRGAASKARPGEVVSPAPPGAASRGAILAGGVLVLVVANVGIWQKEDVIRDGQPIFVALAPVDPRSLMQGDYMRLNFSLPTPAPDVQAGLLRAQRPQVVMRRDARGVATPVRLDKGGVLAPDELRMELTPQDGRWILVTDAWFFTEGEGKRWAPARFGEFRVNAQGQALLVGLRGADLQPL